MISFARISKQYGRQLLFVDASFQLNPGEKVGLVGPNGAGKTTLLRMIVGEEAAAGLTDIDVAARCTPYPYCSNRCSCVGRYRRTHR
jgi:ATPase subunit of ABC transporter with duplicated ATPase domains